MWALQNNFRFLDKIGLESSSLIAYYLQKFLRMHLVHLIFVLTSFSDNYFQSFFAKVKSKLGRH